MPEALEIALAPEVLNEGSSEERAAFGMFTIHANGIALTEGIDYFTKASRPGPLVSGYHAAEWFAWNWWRLMHEPYREGSESWGMAHRLPAIGAGYVWPNIEIRSDGRRVVLLARASTRPDAKPFRFVGSPSPWVGSREALEEAIDAFIPAVIGRLRTHELKETNLDRVWAELRVERQDPEVARQRKLEALLGLDPDDAPDQVLAGLLSDSKALGADAVDEIAADAPNGQPLRAADLEELAQRARLQADATDAVRLSPPALTAARRQEEAWRQGKLAAERLRSERNLGEQLLRTPNLLQMLGAAGEPEATNGAPLSFLLHRRGQRDAIVLRSRFPTGQRFELARLLGDHLLFGKDARALPATQAYTFRQRAQRSFAAELLSPFEAVEGMLNGDFSEEAIEDVARHFEVSTLTIRTLLVNHGRIERESLANVA